MSKNIYITGLGLCTPLGYGKEATLEKLRSGQSALKVQSLGNGDTTCLMGRLPAIAFNQYIDWKEPFLPTPYSRLFILGCLDAINDAAIGPHDIEATGCVMETSLGPSESVEDYMKELLHMRHGIISPMKFTRTVANTALGDASRYFKLKGPSCILLTESSVSYAYDLINLDMADIIICCAIDVLTGEVVRYKEHEGRLLHHQADVNEIGDTAPAPKGAWSSGCCAVVLEAEESMKRRGIKPYARLTLCREKAEGGLLTGTQPPHQLSTHGFKNFTGDMFYASTLFGLAAACLSIDKGETYRVGEACTNAQVDSALITSEREGGLKSYFIINKINQQL